MSTKKDNTLGEETSGTTAAPAQAGGARVRVAAVQVIRALEELCDSLHPGDRIPTHLELMRQFGASERAVLHALDDLQRRGRIVRRRRAGTFVTLAPPRSPAMLDARTIVAVAPTDHAFFDRTIDLFCRYAEAADLSPVCKPVIDTHADSLSDLSRVLAGSDAASFIVFSIKLESVATQLQASGARVVLFGTPTVDTASVSVPWVYGDQEYGGYLITDYLLELGHRRIAYVLFGAGELRRQLRWQGHQRALSDAGRRGIVVESGVIEDIAQWDADPARAAAYLRGPGAPTALLCWNDYETIRLLSILSRAGVKVPTEVSLAGYDNLPQSRLIYPSLTTVDPSLSQMIRVAIDLIIRTEPPQPARTILVPSLVPRESTAPPPPVAALSSGRFS